MDAVSFVKGSDDLVEGLAIPFTGPFKGGKDFDGEDFGPDTDYAFDWFPHGRPALFDHGVDGALKTTVTGRQTSHEITDEGVWAQVQLDRSAKYHAVLKDLIAAGKMFFSSGSMPHLVQATKSGHITRWPWVELSFTPTPSNAYAAVHPVKSVDLIARMADAGIEPSAQLIAAALKALDAIPTDDDSLPAGLKFADHADRLLGDVEEFRDRISGLIEVRAKSGRVLSAQTRERLLRHPASLRELADDLDGLLSEADADKVAKVIEPALLHQVAETLRRADDVLVHA